MAVNFAAQGMVGGAGCLQIGIKPTWLPMLRCMISQANAVYQAISSYFYS